jgi:DnaJ-class molecular chaperone
MSSREQLRDDLAIMNIDEDQELTKQYVTSKYKKLAKQRHPDKDAGTKSAFQELQNAYRRIIKHLEETEESDESGVEDFETEFFKRHNIMKECTTSFVVYIQNGYVEKWRKVLGLTSHAGLVIDLCTGRRPTYK